MSLDSATFLVRFPEFTGAPEALIDACIEEANVRSGDTTGTRAGYLAAHLLACAPGGRQIRNSPQASTKEQETTPYWKQYMELVRIVGGGPWCP